MAYDWGRMGKTRRKLERRIRRWRDGQDAQRRILIEEAEDYRMIAEMRADREFDDRPGGGNANRLPQDVFTRAAHIKILNPGTCRVRSGWGR